MAGSGQVKDEFDGSISAGSETAIVDGVDSNIKASVLDKANSNPQAVAVVDSNGDQITSFGGGTQYTEGDTDASITGTAILWEDTSDTLRPVSASKPLPVSVKDSALPTGAATSAKQDTIIGHVDGIETLLTAIDGHVDQIEGYVDGIEGLLTTIDADTGTIADAIKAEDVGHSSGDKGMMMLGVRNDNVANLSGTDGDYTPIAVDAGGRPKVLVNSITYVADGTELTTANGVKTVVNSALPAGTNAIGKLAANSGVDIGDVDVTSVVPGTGATNLGKAEDGGHSSGDVGVFALSVRNDTPNATLAANADYQQISTDMVGGIRTALYETDFAVLGTNHVKKYGRVAKELIN